MASLKLLPVTINDRDRQEIKPGGYWFNARRVSEAALESDTWLAVDFGHSGGDRWWGLIGSFRELDAFLLENEEIQFFSEARPPMSAFGGPLMFVIALTSASSVAALARAVVLWAHQRKSNLTVRSENSKIFIDGKSAEVADQIRSLRRLILEIYPDLHEPESLDDDGDDD